MSAYSTKRITRKEAEDLYRQILMKQLNFASMSDIELAEILDKYSYSEEHKDILGVLHNFLIE